MANNTMIPLATYTVTGSNLDGPTGVTFNVPSGYTDLIIKCNIKSTAPAIILGRLNGDTSTNYSHTGMGNGPASTRSADQADLYFSAYAHTTTNWNTHTYTFFQYSNSYGRKNVLMRGDNSTYGVDEILGCWKKTPEPITSIRMYLDRAESFVVGSTWTVYGVKALDSTPKATGGTIYADGSNFYHVFSSTGTFTPTQSLTADILVVAGGGGGGSQVGGGGGAGGVQEFFSQSLSATSYTCTVGSGGAPGTYTSTGPSTNAGSNGGNSQFGALTASVGGGGGGAYAVTVGKNGGSGGGGASGSDAPYIPLVGGSGTAGQGYGGGTGYYSDWSGGGGGGAGAAGADGVANIGGNGGIGRTTPFINDIGYITGMGELSAGNYYFGGGGGGCNTSNSTGHVGYGGIGGGANGANNSQATSAGDPNTGGGGGGSRDSISPNYILPSAGGSGVVIVRYSR